MLGAIALVLMRDGNEWGVALAFTAVMGSFLVSYTRARAEALGLRGDVGLSSRAERVVIISVGLRVRLARIAPVRRRDPDRDRLDHGRTAGTSSASSASREGLEA